MTKVAFFNVDEKEQAVLSKEFAGEKTFELRFNPKSLDKHTACIAKEAGGIGIFIQSKITQEVLDHLPMVRFIKHSFWIMVIQYGLHQRSKVVIKEHYG